ncbi:MAG: PASTA domain-containing protein [Ferruginibacter sp.]|nr:PASTA domain-containing protein [Cytophagales bacterium]
MKVVQLRTVRDVLIHLGTMASLLISLFLGFFFLYLPAITHPGEKVLVPDLKGMTLKAGSEFLADRDLRYEVSDSSYVPKARPLTILSQFPQPGDQVKADRKIFVTITTFNPPEVPMPDLLGLPLRSADMQLQSAGLQRGNIRYVPEFSSNVLRQEYGGQPIARQAKIPKGARVDLVLGDGIGPSEFAVPGVVGKPRAEAEILLRGSGLRLRTRYDYGSGGQPGTVVRQQPAPRPDSVVTIRRGQTITLWVAADSLNR